MNSSERIVADRQAQEIRDINDEIRNRPIGGGGGGGRIVKPVGMGNFAGWGMSAGLIGAVLGGIVEQGIAGAIFGGLLFAGFLWVLAFIAKRSGAYDANSRPLIWTLIGAIIGAAIGAVASMIEPVPFLYAVKTWAIFLGGLAGIYCWICRFIARRPKGD
jgi:hypothetical protein